MDGLKFAVMEHMVVCVILDGMNWMLPWYADIHLEMDTVSAAYIIEPMVALYCKCGYFQFFF